MLKRFILAVLAVLLCAPVFAKAAAIYYGFEHAGGTTDTQNLYFFDDYEVYLVENKEAFYNFDFENIHAGSYILLPLGVYVDGARRPSPVTDKMVKNDKVTFSYKATRGEQYVEELTLVDGKKLKIKDVPAGTYIKIPFIRDLASDGRPTISIELVLSVNDITYQYTQTTLNCRIKAYTTEIRRSEIYGALSPTIFKVDKNYAGKATFDFGNEIKYTTKVKKGATYYLNLSREPDKDIAAMYPGAVLDFYNFLGNHDAFPVVGKLEIPVDLTKLSKKGVAPAIYVYRIDGNTLTSLSTGVVSFDVNSSKLTINTKSLNSYVISNQPLSRTVSATDSDILQSGYAS